MNTNLLTDVASRITTGFELCGSKWQNAEAEVIAMQTICACAANFNQHGDAFSWLNENCLRGRASCGTDNASGLQRLINDGSLVRERYKGLLKAPKGTARSGGLPSIVRVTDDLLAYAAEYIKAKKQKAKR